jgi:hypothetical protein
MDARERFEKVVVPNYTDFVRNPNDFRSLDNVIGSMNTVAEYLGLHRSGYPPHVSRNERRRNVQTIRQGALKDLQTCADVLKHTRIGLEQGGVTSTLSSTGIDTADPTTWKVGGLDLVQVAHDAFAALKQVPELNAPST